jgi:hypothetical protein
LTDSASSPVLHSSPPYSTAPRLTRQLPALLDNSPSYSRTRVPKAPRLTRERGYPKLSVLLANAGTQSSPSYSRTRVSTAPRLTRERGYPKLPVLLANAGIHSSPSYSRTQVPKAPRLTRERGYPKLSVLLASLIICNVSIICSVSHNRQVIDVR